MSVIFSFDFGTGSLAAAIRVDNQFIFKRSFTMAHDFASTKTARARRRLARTRQAHRAREFWWNEQARALGLPLLKTFKPLEQEKEYRVDTVDDRLKREFPHKDDTTVYCSALLRIMILEGKIRELEDWQIYKAVHSAIQKRGYDGYLPWANGIDRNTDADAEEQKNVHAFNAHLASLKLPETFHKPCYFEAYKMGLWDPHLGIKSMRINHLAEQAATTDFKGYTAPRSMVEDELKDLLTAIKAVKKDLDVDFVLYGPGKKQYASYYKDVAKQHALKRGSDADWQGLMGQKIPRFDNRIIDKCRLIPRFNVCKASDHLYKTFHLAQKLHHLRVFDGRNTRQLALSEYRSLFKQFEEAKKASPSQLKKALKACGNLMPASDKYEIPPAKESGRSAFCRPALKMLIEIYTEGKTPKELYEDYLQRPCAERQVLKIKDNKDPNKGLMVSDLEWLKSLHDTSWEGFYLPQTKLDQYFTHPDKKKAISKLIGSVNNPVVRHRLQLLVQTLDDMQQTLTEYTGGKVKEPDHVAFEVIREDFMGEKAKRELQKAQREAEVRNKRAKERVCELGITGGEAVRKLLCWERQDGMDPYTGKNISNIEIGNCEIDHIVPQTAGGPDSMFNLVLTAREANQNKGDRTPYHWLAPNPQKWENYLNFLEQMSKLPRKTKELLTSPQAEELVQKYTDLAETAYISRLTGTILHLYFDWETQREGGAKRIEFITGGQTAAVRRDYKLDKILSDSLEEVHKKNRKDPRHHMLDALVISFLAEKFRKLDKRNLMKLPDGFTQDFFRKEIETHVPIEMRSKPQIEDNFYGFVDTTEKKVFKREELRNLAYKMVNMKEQFDLALVEKNLKNGKIYANARLLSLINDMVLKLKTSASAQREWDRWCAEIRLKSGARWKKAKVSNDLTDEMKPIPVPKSGLHGKQIIKPKGNHRGFVIFRDKKTWKAQPVYGWQSLFEAKKAFNKKGVESRCFVQSGNVIEIQKDIGAIKSGKYVLKTLMNGIQAQIVPITEPSAKQISISVNRLVSEGDFIVIPRDRL